MNNNYQAPDVEIVKLTEALVDFGKDELDFDGDVGLASNLFE